MTKRRLVIAAVAVALCGAGWFGIPPLLRGMDAFRVRSVEVSGVRLLTPREVLETAGVRADQNVFDEKTGWTTALLAHDGIEGVEIRRRLPGTLRIRVMEKEPVALLDDGVLRLATAAGELLPTAPAGATFDLPIVRTPDADSAEVSTLEQRVLGEIGRLARIDPALLGEVSEVRPHGVDAIALTHRHAEILVPAGVDAPRVAELRAVLADLVERAGAETLEHIARVTVDLRFADQIVVRFPSSV